MSIAAVALKKVEDDLRTVEHEIAELARWERLNGNPHAPLRHEESAALGTRYMQLVVEREQALADKEHERSTLGDLFLSGQGYDARQLDREQRPINLSLAR